jgi:hypothetical protein
MRKSKRLNAEMRNRNEHSVPDGTQYREKRSKGGRYG